MSEVGLLPNHLRALGFNRNPFPQTPDADCYFRTEQIAQSSLEAFHCLKAGKGFVLLTGEVGTGKSTFLRCLMDELYAADCAVSYVFNTFLQGRHLLLALNRDFGVAAGADFAEDILLLNQYLIRQYAIGRCCVLVIDDAQNLDAESLELLRLLSNLETRQNKLLQIVLSGQPELLDILDKRETRQLTSRIMQHIQLWPFDRSECTRYVNFRISRAGTDGRISLSPWANRALYWYSKGNPRRIHSIMDRCLYGIAPGVQQEIGLALIRAGAREGGVAGRFRYKRQISLLAACILCVVVLASWLPEKLDFQANAVQRPVITASAAVNQAKERVASSFDQIQIAQSQHTVRVKGGNRVVQCLKKFDVEFLYADLNNGLDFLKRRLILKKLADQGLALAFLPAGLRLPDATNESLAQTLCSDIGKAGSWVLWKPKYLPFDVNRSIAEEKIRWLQTQLGANKLYVAEVDGLFGPRTVQALHQFQRWHGLPTDNRVDAWVLFLLEHEVGKVSA